MQEFSGEDLRVGMFTALQRLEARRKAARERSVRTHGGGSAGPGTIQIRETPPWEYCAELAAIFKAVREHVRRGG